MKKRIAIVTPDLRSGGSERAASELTRAFGDKYDFYYIVFDDNDISYEVKAKLIDINAHASNSFVKKVYNTFKRANGIRYAVKRYKIDIVMAFTPIANRALRLSGVKCRKIASCRGFEDLELHTNEYHACVSAGCEILFNSNEALDWYMEKYPSDRNYCFAIHNLIDCNKISEMSEEELPAEHRKFYDTHRTISNVAILSVHKGHWDLFKSFELIKEDVPDAGLVIVGHRGKIEENIREMAKRNKFADDILLVGYSPNPFKYVRASDVYALSSISEGFPNALAEAMCCGTPCVSTSCRTGPKELLFDDYKNKNISAFGIADNGIITECFDGVVDFDYSNKNDSHKIFAQAVVRMLTDKKLACELSEKGKVRASFLDRDVIYGQYEKYLDK